MSKEERKYEKRSVKEELNYSVGKGIDSLIQANPLFKDQEEYILKHLDKKAVQEKIQDAYEAAKEKNLSGRERLNYIKSEIVKYVSSGRALDESGKEIILKKGLEGRTAGKGFLARIFPRRKEEGLEYLEQTLSAFQDLYSLFKSNGPEYEKKMPEISKALNTINDMKFLAPAIDVLKYYKMIDDRKYRDLKGSINKKTKTSSAQVVSGIERSITQDIAAGIFGIVGIVMLFASRMSLTGNVAGISLYEPSITLFHALAPLTVSLILFWRNKRRMNSKKFKKIKLKE